LVKVSDDGAPPLRQAGAGSAGRNVRADIRFALNKQAVKVSWAAAGRDSHELTGAFTPRLAGTCHLAITYAGAHIQGAAAPETKP
jgi:hypothetical protein